MARPGARKPLRRCIAVTGAVCMAALPVTGQTITIDNSDAQFTVLSETWETGTTAPGHWAEDYRWRLTSGAGETYGQVEWRPDIPSSGPYLVSVHYPQGSNRADNAPFTVHHANGSDLISINQQTDGGQWNPLGTFDFDAGTSGSVALDNVANQSVVIADAIRFTAQSGGAEFRGFWADAFHVGFKSTSQINNMVSRAATGNYNAIIAEVLAYHDNVGGGHGAYWNSSILPKASDISGGIDPLAYLVQQAHANGLEVHTWLVAYRVCTSWPPSGNPTVSGHPEWIMVPRGDMDGGPAKVDGKYTLDPGSPDAQEYLISIVRELVTNYEIDGVHWDYIRYTSTDAGYPAHNWYTESGLARFKAITGYSGTPSTSYGPWNDFRRQEVTELVRRAQAEIATIDSNPQQPLRHTAALVTWGNASSNFQSTSAWSRFQNWREWMEEGYLDAGIPMTYYDEGVYPTWYRNWVDQEMIWRYNRHIFVGPGIYLNTFADSITQMTYARNAGADGLSSYSYASTYDGGTDWSWYSYVASNLFTGSASPPDMPWRDPVAATEGTVYGRVTDGSTGEPIDDATIKVNGFPVVQTDGNGFYVITQLSAGPSGTLLPLSAGYSGYADAQRPAVLVERASFTEANFALGNWLPGDYDVDADVDLDDYTYYDACQTGPEGGPLAAGCDLFDFDVDADVDLEDHRVFQESFGR